MIRCFYELNYVLFVLHVDLSFIEIGSKEYCNKVKSIGRLLKIGVECKVFEKIDWGYGENDKFRVNINGEGDWSKFRGLVGSSGGSGKLYSEYKE